MVLPYPKPLTISRHTVSAVKTPLLTPMERFGWCTKAGSTPSQGGGSASC